MRQGATGAARARRPVLLALALLLSVALARPVRAQWVVDASAGGTEHEALAASVGTRSAMLGVRHEGPRWLYLSGGAPVDSAGLPWVAAGVGTRLQGVRGGLRLGLDVAGHAHGYRAPVLDATGGGVLLEALPFAAWTGGGARVELRSGVVHYRSTFDGVAEDRSLLQSGARLSARPAAGVVLAAEGRFLRAEEGDYPFLGAALELSLGRAELSAHAGRWLAAALDDAVWGVDGRLPVGGRTEVYVGVEQEAPHPLYWNDSRRSWTVGVSHALGPRPAWTAPAAVAPVAAGGRVEIRLPLSVAERAPSVGGDFNDWQPVPMQRSGDAWIVSLALEPGVYHYAFRRANGDWFVPASVPNRVDDGFGGQNAVLVVGPREGS